MAKSVAARSKATSTPEPEPGVEVNAEKPPLAAVSELVTEAPQPIADATDPDMSLAQAEADRVLPQQLSADFNPTPFAGHLDSLENGVLRGWAFDSAHPDTPTVLRMIVDGQDVGEVVCDLYREDVRTALGHPTGYLGYESRIPVAFFDGEPHTVALRFASGSAVPAIDPVTPDLRWDGLEFADREPVDLVSNIDGFKRGKLRGWVFNHHKLSDERPGGVLLSVTVDGSRVGQVRADRYRGDAASVLGCDPNCGFEVSIPQRFKGNGEHTIRVFSLPENTELSGSPYVTSLASNALEAQLVDVSRTIEGLHREITRLRNEFADTMPVPDYDLNDYDPWARKYYELLRERVDAARDNTRDPTTRPLVSILVPTYKPLISDFTAAIDSVIAQTYSNWELIIIDDGCKSDEVMKVVDDYCARDKRIRNVRLKKNLGIAGATNAGMDAAQGDYTLFFDHDDLLVDVAVELMVDGAERTGARMVFSDEDKIDQAGYYLEPNLKPDFNYRYLLGCNYICHITMVETALMRKVGHLRTEYDGAQDHDFVLRVTEEIPFSQIHHVREVLYHWRKTPNSTAVTVGNKTYAIDAGVRAVGDHLKRRGVKATVASVNGLTLYGVKWKLPPKLPLVSIVIPFKDEIETTRRCLDDLLANTKYTNFDVVLVNNWSVTDEAKKFIAQSRKIRNVRVLDVEEPFNYSRLNNLACADNPADFFVFLNNDVFIDQTDWLDILVGEALSADDVGIVGMKLLYPDNTMQHTGVIVGAASVAAHVHRGLKYDDYGYIGRAALSNEYSAVTAAGMLVRASAYKAVGGFDEVHLKVAYNDVDFCLKVREAGFRVVYCAEVSAFHHESLSRGSDQKPDTEARFFAESQVMQKRWADKAIFRTDPGYSRFFTVDRVPFFNLVDPARLD